MRRVFRWMLCLMVFLVTGCEWEETRIETGYKGRARINPWLAAERFFEKTGHEVKSSASWKNPGWEDTVYLIPAELLNNQSFVDRVEEWVTHGGHLILLGDYSQAEWNDWYEFRSQDLVIEKPLAGLLERHGIKITTDRSDGREVKDVEFGGHGFKVETGLRTKVNDGFFQSVESGYGRLSVIGDARMFRNRNIDQQDHVSFLKALAAADGREGVVVFLRGSGVSLWEMFRRHLWPLLCGLAALLIFWAWKNMVRFGPTESAAAASPLRGYDHHLEALGDFQWRLDKGRALLAPLRELIIENGQKLAVKSGRRDADFFAFLSERSGVPRERVVRALSEVSPSDSAVLTRTAADLQLLIRATGRTVI